MTISSFYIPIINENIKMSKKRHFDISTIVPFI